MARALDRWVMIINAHTVALLLKHGFFEGDGDYILAAVSLTLLVAIAMKLQKGKT